jgi:hypothetical protein
MNTKYPWDDLKKPGDQFVWRNWDDWPSLRAQAAKQGRRRRVHYSVRKCLLSIKGKPAQAVVVSLVQLIP